MVGIFRKLTLVHKGLRYKLMLAFCLMSIIPLLVCGYLVTIYIFPGLTDIGDTSIVVILSAVIAVLGLVLAKGLVEPVIDMALEARVIANGGYDKKLAVTRDDEIGNLGESINIMTQKIKSNLEELKNYGERTREINIEIHQKILALSSLLQIGDIISSSPTDIRGILEVATQKVAGMFDSGFAALYMMKEGEDNLVPFSMHNLVDENLENLVIKKGRGLLGTALAENSIIIIDESLKLSEEAKEFKSSCNIKNIIAMPIYIEKKEYGILLVGNRIDDFKYRDDDVDLVKVFAKQIGIAVENNLLLKKAEDLAITDDLTNLYNRSYIMMRLGEEIKRAIFYQRPCSFLVLSIDDFEAFRQVHGEIAAEETLRRMARLIRDDMDPIDKAARIGGDEFAMLLPERNKREATSIAEDVRKKVEATSFVKDKNIRVTVSVGVSENPIDGATAEELLKKAQGLLREAKSSGKNKVAA